jgi:hypothetical protein
LAAENPNLINYLDTIKREVVNKCCEKYTGKLIITFYFNQGGIRSCEKQQNEFLYIEQTDN